MSEDETFWGASSKGWAESALFVWNRVNTDMSKNGPAPSHWLSLKITPNKCEGKSSNEFHIR